MVALLDTTRPEEGYSQYVDEHYRFWKRERFAEHFDAMRGMSFGEKLRYAMSKVERKLRSWFAFTEKARRANRIEQVERNYSGILARYEPEPYDGRVVLIVNEELQRLLPDAGWRDLVADSLETHVVPGDHVTRLSMNGEDTADLLRACIDRSLATRIEGARSA